MASWLKKRDLSRHCRSFDNHRDFIPYLGWTVAEGTLAKIGIYVWHLKKLLVERAQYMSRLVWKQSVIMTNRHVNDKQPCCNIQFADLVYAASYVIIISSFERVEYVNITLWLHLIRVDFKQWQLLTYSSKSLNVDVMVVSVRCIHARRLSHTRLHGYWTCQGCQVYRTSQVQADISSDFDPSYMYSSEMVWRTLVSLYKCPKIIDDCCYLEPSVHTAQMGLPSWTPRLVFKDFLMLIIFVFSSFR